MRRTLWILSLACIFPVTGQAQQHTGAAMPMMSGMRVSAASAPMAAPRMAVMRPMSSVRPVAARPARTSTRIATAPRPIHPITWNRGTRSNTPADPVFPYGNPIVNGYPVPGLGFDYTHYFAVHPNAGRCHHCFGDGFGNGYVVPFIDGGLYLPYPMYAEQPEEAQPAEESAPTEQVAQGEEAPPPENYYNPPARTAPQPAPKPQAEYVFVRRDGTLIFAVAYSWINDRLQYVTEEGLRRTVPANTIDLDATQQFNDQRGVPIRLPA